jgi:hypothetical protein
MVVTEVQTPPELAFDPGRPVGGPVASGWREGTLTRAKELEALTGWVLANDPRPGSELLVPAIHMHLAAAREAATAARLQPRRWVRGTRHGAQLERAMSNLDAGEAELLNVAGPGYVLGQVPCLLRRVQCHLTPGDPRRREMERLAQRLGFKDPDHPRLTREAQVPFDEQCRIVDEHRGNIVTATRGASSAALREQVRLRDFRNVVVATTVLMTVLAIALAVTGWRNPTWIPACFAPEEAGRTTVVCPTQQSASFPSTAQPGAGAASTAPEDDIDEQVAETVRSQDMFVIELVGLAAAAIAAATAVRHIRGSSERKGLPLALALLKLPTGAVTAVLGLLLLRGEFVPGLSALDTSAQIIAWALVFGYAQHLFTRLLDQQGQVVLDDVRKADKHESEPAPA